MTFIKIKRSKQLFYQLYSNHGRKFAQSPSLVKTYMIDKFQTFQGLSFFSHNNSMAFQCSEIQGLFQAGLEFKYGAGTMN